MDDLELEPVRVVEEHGVVAGQVRVLLGLALELNTLSAHPVRALVDLVARVSLEGDVVESDPVPVEGHVVDLRLAQPDRRPRAGQVPDRLPALALDLGDAV